MNSLSSPPLANVLGFLVESDLLRRGSHAPDVEYLFKHVLVQQSAYDSLLRTDRRRLHRLVAESLEHTWAEGAGQTLLLAQHWDQAGDPARAFDYYVRSGEEASLLSANREALMAFDRAKLWAEELHLTAAVRLSLYLARGRVLEHSGDFANALAAYQMLEELARVDGDHATRLEALLHRTTLYATPNQISDWQKAEKLSLDALALAQAIGNRPAQAKVLWNRLLANFTAGHNVEAVEYGERGVAIARELNLREQLAYLLNDIARPYFIIGRAADAQAAMAESQMLWRELKNLPMLADNLISTGMASLFIGDYRVPPRDLEEGLRISEELGNLWGQSYAHETLGLLFSQAGKFQRALQHLSAAAKFGAQVNYVYAQYSGLAMVAMIYEILGAYSQARDLLESVISNPDAQSNWLTELRTMLARIEADAGDFDSANRLLEQAERSLASTVGGLGLVLFHFAKCHVLLLQSHSNAALVQAQQGVQELDANGEHPFREILMFYQALAHEQLGLLDEAIATAETARREAEATGGRTWLWAIFAGLTRMYASSGETNRAREMKQNAVAEIQFIAANAPPEFRESFWNRPEIRALHELMLP